MIGFAKALGDRLEVAEVFTAAELGQAFGRDQAVHAAIAPGGLADKLSRELARLQEFRSDAAPRERQKSNNKAEAR